MKMVKHLLADKGADVWSVSPQDSVYDAIDMMAQKGVGALMVMDGAKPIGIVSERDYARKVILAGKSSKSTPVNDIMSADLVSVELASSVDECMSLMTEFRIRHLPVIEKGGVVGMVSIGDLVKAIIAEQQQTIEQLEQYISS